MKKIKEKKYIVIKNLLYSVSANIISMFSKRCFTDFTTESFG